MLPKPHGGRLVDRTIAAEEREQAAEAAANMPFIEVSPELATEAMNIATGVFSPLEGFLGRDDFESVLEHGRLADGVPWTIPIVLDLPGSEARRLPDQVALCDQNGPFATMEVREVYQHRREQWARAVFGTTDDQHPGVTRLKGVNDHLIGGRIKVFREIEAGAGLERYRLRPTETRVLFEARKWRTVVGFQTRNVPHLGHEYVQKTALSFVDGIFVNPVVGRKKSGDFSDDIILKSYDALVTNYYPKDRAVLSTLETEMRYAGPREAVHHAILRKNFGCTHFIVGRDHAGVGNFYAPYAAHAAFDKYPDLGIQPLFFTAFFYCTKCTSIANEKTCPHTDARQNFSGTLLRRAITTQDADVLQFIRPEVAAVLKSVEHAFVK
jgi:sulfate adenylyltransferase